MRLRVLALAAMLSTAAAADDFEIPPWIVRFVALGRTNSVQTWLDEQEKAGVTDRSLAAIRAAALSRAGQYSDSLPLFEAGDGSAYYEQHGIRYHADALRETGYGHAAAALRAEHAATADIESTMVFTEDQQRVWDLRAVSDLDAALVAGEALVLRYPGSGVAWTTLAEVYLDLGQLDEARIVLAIGAGQNSRGPRQVALTQLRMHLIEGEFDEATALLRQLKRRLAGRAEFWEIYLEYLLLTDDAPQAQKMVSRPRFSDNTSPAFNALRARSLAAVGEPDAAATLMAELMADYPTHRQVVRAAALLDEAGVINQP